MRKLKVVNNSVHELVEKAATEIEKLSPKEKAKLRNNFMRQMLPNRLPDGRWIN